MEIINKQENNHSNIIRVIIEKYLPYWPVFLILMIVCGTGAWIYLQTATPLYQSSSKLLINDEKKGAQTSEAVESLDKISSNKIIENETEVIQSKAILGTVVRQLGLYAGVYKEEKLHDVLAYTNSPVRIDAQHPETISASEKIAFNVDKKNNSVLIDAKKYQLDKWINTKNGVIKFTLNEAFKNNGNNEKFYYTLTPVKDVVSTIASRLEVSTTTKESSILDLSVKDEDPVRSKNILDEIMLVYNLSVINDKNTLAANTLNFIDTRLVNVGHDLDSIESRIQQYKAQQDAVDINTQGKLYMENVSDNQQRLSDINIQLAALSQVQSYVQSKNGSEGIVPSTAGINDPMLAQLLDKLYTAQTDYDNLKKTTGEDNPIVVSVKNQVDKLRPNILENIQNHRSALLASKQDLSVTNNNYSGVLHAIPQKEKRLLDINRQQGIKNDLYDFLLQKKEETSLSLASNAAASKIIDSAEFDSSPVSPNKKLVYIISILVALVAGIGIVFGKESLAKNIMFRNDIETLTAYPVIAEIGAKLHNSNSLLDYNSRSIINEQFRKLRITLRYLGINSTNQKRILITSAISGEGKSFIASNLALNIALGGKKVVLVDFDMNNHSLTNAFNIKRNKTLSDYLNDGINPEQLLHSIDLNENLFFIPAGELPEDPSELMTNERIESLLNYLDANFDYIVIDSAPVNPVTDAYILSPYCDATLFVVRHGYTPKVFVEQIDNENNKQLKNVSIVFNGVRARGYGNKYYGYGYSYGNTYQNVKAKKQKYLN